LNDFSLPVHVDAGLGEHEEPEVHVGGSGVERVVDQHAAIRNPKGRKDGNDASQHFHNLKEIK
jgi:hypothetical protein